ncbi:MAG: right-handed parallel beta-helix repeat-containing protein [Acidobacteria bacterium]|nr:right-handed parallel beta-helix repeat-containing protein [Acidobacteriota bacterium]
MSIPRLYFYLFVVGLVVSGSVSSAWASGRTGKSTTYYVDSAAGKDSNSGASAKKAWKSLDKINATTFAPGDSILLKSGAKWTGQLWPKGSGSAERPIRVGKFGGDAKPLIQGNGEVEDAVLLKNQEYWEIQDLEISNHGAKPALRRGVHVAVENYGEAHHIYLRNLSVHDVNGIDDDKVNGGIHYTCEGDTKPSRFVDLRIEDNQITRVDRSGIFGWSSHWVRSKWYPSLGVIIRGNVLEDIGGDGIVVVATDGALLEHNIVGHANQRSEGYNVAIWPWSADNTIVQYNEAYGTKGQRDGEGFDSDWNSRNTLIQYNYSHENDGGFLLICDEGGHSAGESIGNLGTVVRYNISVNDHHRGITIAGPIDDALIYNNTIYVGKEEKVSLLLHTDWNGWGKQARLYNNIFYVEGSASFAYGESRKPDGEYVLTPGFGQSRNNIFDSNIYYGNVAPVQEDAHALTSDPLLAGPGKAPRGREHLQGYTLGAQSPAVDTGKAVPDAGPEDFFGNKIPACKQLDRGAAEFSGCAP